MNLFNAKSYFDGTRSLNNKSNIHGLYYVSRAADEAQRFRKAILLNAKSAPSEIVAKFETNPTIRNGSQ